MKKQLVCLCFLLLAGLPWTVRAAGPDPGKGPGNRAAMERIITLRNWKLMKTFDLSEKEAQEVFAILDKTDTRRAELIRKRRNILQRLRQETEKSSSDGTQLSRLIDQYLEVIKELAALPAEELAGIRKVFTIRDQARYLVFSQDMAREIRMMMRPRPADSTRRDQR